MEINYSGNNMLVSFDYFLKNIDLGNAHNLKIKTSGSDCHRVTGAGISGIITNEPIKTNDDLLSILKNGEFEIIEKDYAK